MRRECWMLVDCGIVILCLFLIVVGGGVSVRWLGGGSRPLLLVFPGGLLEWDHLSNSGLGLGGHVLVDVWCVWSGAFVLVALWCLEGIV